MYRCPLAKLDPEPLDTERIKRRGWIEDRILVVSLTDSRLTEREREAVRDIGDKLYKGNI